MRSRHLALHLSLSDLQPPSLTPYPSFSGVQVAVDDAGLLQGSSKSLSGPAAPPEVPLPRPPVMETGEAGPPGKMTTSKPPKGTDGSTMPDQGFAGAPGERPRPTATPHGHAHALHSPLPVMTGDFTCVSFFIS